MTDSGVGSRRLRLRCKVLPAASSVLVFLSISMGLSLPLDSEEVINSLASWAPDDMLTPVRPPSSTVLGAVALPSPSFIASLSLSKSNSV